MSENFDSIYPDFLRTGLGKLHTLGVGLDLRLCSRRSNISGATCMSRMTSRGFSK